ncbi:MAG: hypothetical protein V4480_00015 [Patescibacteria group bacterium]
MNKKLIIALLCALGILLVLGVLFALRTSNRNPATPSVGNPFSGSLSSSTAPGTQQGVISLRARDGSAISATDVTAGKTPLPASSDTYYDLVHNGMDTYGNEDDPFAIQYAAKSSSFIVSLQEEPLGKSRLSAETFLRSTLNLTDAQLCELDITVAVTQAVNEQYASMGNLGLSFCPGAVTLPE